MSIRAVRGFARAPHEGRRVVVVGLWITLGLLAFLDALARGVPATSPHDDRARVTERPSPTRPAPARRLQHRGATPRPALAGRTHVRSTLVTALLLIALYSAAFTAAVLITKLALN